MTVAKPGQPVNGHPRLPSVVVEHPPRQPCPCHDGELVAGESHMRVTRAMPDCTCDVEIRRFETERGSELHAMHRWGCGRALFKGRFELEIGGKR